MENKKIGCVIMASGSSRRFGSNKLLVTFLGEPLLCRSFVATDSFLIEKRIVVTRCEDVRSLCCSYDVPVLFHSMPYRSDTIRLGLTELLNSDPALDACIFLPGDQPLLTKNSIERLVHMFEQEKKRDICRLSYTEQTPEGTTKTVGSPVLFGRRYFDSLLHLPTGKGGSVILKQFPDAVLEVPAGNRYELLDADTPQALEELLHIAQSKQLTLHPSAGGN